MLYNRIFRTVLTPSLASFSYSNGLRSGFTDASTYAPYDFLLTFNYTETAPPPAPYTSWSLLVQRSTNNITWVDTPVIGNWSTTTPGIISIPDTQWFVGSYYRVQTVLRNPTTGVIEERFTNTSSVGPITNYTIATYKVYGAVRQSAASVSSIAGISPPSGSTFWNCDIISAGGAGFSSTGAFYGGGGGGGRLVQLGTNTTPADRFTISVSTGPSGFCSITNTTYGEFFRVRNGGNGFVSAPGQGSTSFNDETNALSWLIQSTDGPNGNLTQGGGLSANFSPLPVAAPSQGPFGNSGLPADNAIIAGYYGFGGNGVPTTFPNASPAQGSGGNVTLTFFKA